MAGHLCTVKRIEDGRVAGLQRVLAGLPQGPASPLGRVEGTHFARWVVVPALTDRHARPRAEWGARLVFSAEYDHSGAEAYLGDLLARAAEEAHAVWSHCDGYPGRGPALAHWLLATHVPAGFSVAAFPEASAGQVRAALARRREVADFAVEARELTGADLKRAYERRFC